MQMTELQTERLYFRKWQDQDYGAIRELFQDEAAIRYIGGAMGPEASWRLMANYLGHYELRGYSYLAVVTKEGDRLVGSVGLWNSEPWPEPELGYWFFPEAQGKGYATEASREVLSFAKRLQLPSLVSYIDAENEPSIRLAERLGARHDGETELLAFGVHQVYRYW